MPPRAGARGPDRNGLGFHVGAVLDQHARDIGMLFGNGPHQGGLTAARLLRVRIAAVASRSCITSTWPLRAAAKTGLSRPALGLAPPSTAAPPSQGWH